MELEKRLLFTGRDGDSIFRSLSEEDVTESYVNVLRNQREFLTANPENIDIHWQQKYIRNIRLSNSDTICGLFSNSVLVGTAGIQNIKKSETATIGIFVFDPELRGKGYGKTLIWSGCYLISHLFSVSSFAAGAKKGNVASWKAFLSCGFQIAEEGKDMLKLALEIGDLRRPDFIDNIKVKRLGLPGKWISEPRDA